jgi:hypothetical protein
LILRIADRCIVAKTKKGVVEIDLPFSIDHGSSAFDNFSPGSLVVSSAGLRRKQGCFPVVIVDLACWLCHISTGQPGSG